MKRWLFVILSLAVAGAGAWFAWRTWGPREKPTSYRTVKIERGDVVQLVRATGTVQPVKLVQVGTQVNGIVLKLNADFNSHVKAGEVVAQIDPAVYQANLSQTQANLIHSQASVDAARANLLKASNDLTRAIGLSKHDLLAQADLDAAVATAASAGADVKVALADVQQNQASLQLARANLGYTTIVSPVDGTVVSRNFDEGQTVVASMTAQTIFTVATDLHTVLISASVPEADVGPIRVGQNVVFNVDAYPSTFTGVVEQVRIASSTMQNVVTYPVMVCATNPGEKLFPGMTANISCIVADHTNVLKVPNTVLRFRPDKAARANKTASTGNPDAADGGGRGAGNSKKLYVQQPDGSLALLPVKTGITDGIWTEVSGDDLREGLDVITGVLENGTRDAVVNPFMPTPPSRQTRPPRM